MKAENPKQQTKTPKPIRPLTRKQQAFVRHLVANPKDSATKAVQATYGKEGKPMSYSTAGSIAVENLQKPAIKLELEKYLSNAEITMLDVMETSLRYGKKDSSKESAMHLSNAISASKDIQDRIKGKATTRVEVRSTKVSVNIDLTGVTSPQE